MTAREDFAQARAWVTRLDCLPNVFFLPFGHIPSLASSLRAAVKEADRKGAVAEQWADRCETAWTERDQLRRQLDAAEASPCGHEGTAFDALERLHARIHRDFNFDAGECAPPTQDEPALRMMDDLVTYADEVYLPLADATRKAAPSGSPAADPLADEARATWTAPDGATYDLKTVLTDRFEQTWSCEGWLHRIGSRELFPLMVGDFGDHLEYMSIRDAIAVYGPLTAPQDETPAPPLLPDGDD